MLLVLHLVTVCPARKPEEVNKQVGESRYTPLHYALLYVNVESISSLVGVHAGEILRCCDLNSYHCFTMGIGNKKARGKSVTTRRHWHWQQKGKGQECNY